MGGALTLFFGFLLPATISASKYGRETIFSLLRSEGPKAIEFIYDGKIGDSQKQGNPFLIALAASYHQIGKPEKGLDLVNSILKQENLPSLDLAQANFTKSKLLLGAKHLEEAIEALALAQDAYREIGYTKAEPFLQVEWARIAYFKELPVESLEILNAIESKEAVRDDIQYLYMHNYTLLQLYSDAIDCAQKLMTSKNLVYKIESMNLYAYLCILSGQPKSGYGTISEANKIIVEKFGDSNYLKFNYYVQWLYGICHGVEDNEAIRIDLIRWAINSNEKVIQTILEDNICPFNYREE